MQAHLAVDHTTKNEQLVILLRTGLNNVLLPKLLAVVNNNVLGPVVRKVDSAIISRSRLFEARLA